MVHAVVWAPPWGPRASPVLPSRARPLPAAPLPACLSRVSTERRAARPPSERPPERLMALRGFNNKEASRGMFLASRTTNAKYRWLPATHGEQVPSKDVPSAGWAPFLPAI